jgi:hypothetical protein
VVVAAHLARNQETGVRFADPPPIVAVAEAGFRRLAVNQSDVGSNPTGHPKGVVCLKVMDMMYWRKFGVLWHQLRRKHGAKGYVSACGRIETKVCGGTGRRVPVSAEKCAGCNDLHSSLAQR